MMRARHRAFTGVWTGVCLLLVSACASACAGDSLTGATVLQRYRYVGEQRTPFLTSVSGTLSVTKMTGDRFDGMLDVLQTGATGLVDRRTGIVHGKLASGAMDFDVMLEGDVYRHVGRSVSDTVSGSWIDASAVGDAASGTFRLERIP